MLELLPNPIPPQIAFPKPQFEYLCPIVELDHLIQLVMRLVNRGLLEKQFDLL